MNKQALLNIDPKTVGRYATGGAIAGASAASLIDLVHMVREMNQERKKRLAPNETDENTIVLNLPKRAFVEGSANEPTKVKVTTSYGSKLKSLLARRGELTQERTDAGKYGKKASTGWPTLTASTLAAIGGAGLGSAVVDKIYEQRQERRLKAELEAAKHEYASSLTGAMKSAFVEDLFSGADQFTKQADVNSGFGFLNYPLAAMALLTILGTGGTGYLTKKILDEKLRDTNDKSLDVPKVKRIVLQSQPEVDPTKHASAEDVDGISATLLAMMSAISGDDSYMNTPAIKSAAAAAGLTTPQVSSMSLTDPNFIRTIIDKNPELYKAMVARSQHSVLGRLPGARRYVANSLAANAQKLVGEPKVAAFLAKEAQTATGGATSGNNGGLRKLVGKTKIKTLPTWMKASDDLSPAIGMAPALSANLISTITGRQHIPDASEIASQVVAQQNLAEEHKRMEGVREPSTVEIASKGEAATQYLTANQKRIVALVKRLAAEGQI